MIVGKIVLNGIYTPQKSNFTLLNIYLFCVLVCGISNKVFQNASILMCYCSFEIGQFSTLNNQSERQAIEMLFKFQISPDHPSCSTN